MNNAPLENLYKLSNGLDEFCSKFASPSVKGKVLEVKEEVNKQITLFLKY